MQSPKFLQKVRHLRKIIHATRLSDLWKGQIRARMRTQIVPDAVEFLDFHLDLRKRCTDLEELICRGNYRPKPIMRLTVEKSKGLCRQIALPDPSDALVLQALSNTLWEEIKKQAPSDTAFFAPQDQPFQKRNPIQEDDEWGYGPIESWMDFQEEILNFSKKRKYVFVTDIANYYDSIIHNFLRAILSDYGLEREHALDLLLFILDATLWRPDYMPNIGIGLPQMDLDAPRLLAHTHLFEVDALFSNSPDVDYARFMDDIDFGVDTIAKAKTVLRDLDLALQTRNLRLNSGKTKILTAAEAWLHFRIADNKALDEITARISNRSYLTYWRDFYSRYVPWLIARGLKTKRFESGNGGKIIKRLLTRVAHLDAPLPDSVFRTLLYDFPGLRPNLFKTWSVSEIPASQINILAAFLQSGQAVDDLVFVSSVMALVNSPFAKPMTNTQFRFIRYALSDGSPAQTYALLILTARFETPSLLLWEIKDKREIWSKNIFLGRLVAGFSPLFRYTPEWQDFRDLVVRWSGPEVLSVLDFHEEIAAKSVGYNKVRKFVEAGNPSLGVGISFAKVMMVLGAIKNGSLSKIERAKLVGKNPKMMSDYHYHRLVAGALSSMP